METNLNNVQQEVDTGNDSIVIMQYIDGIPGGRSLDTTGFTETVIKAGHVVIKDSDGVYKPMPVASGAYDTLPDGSSYVGVVQASVLTEKPMAGIMIRGKVNEVASPYAVTAAIKTALPHIIFTED
ncbi:MAG: hypothetical protein PHO12_07850 [Bacteroidales bacterium]|nr:hypothetical protein [Bacteroidales bacterium]MDD4685122.1 hypothetical protein [Bacteroidales bacterium]